MQLWQEWRTRFTLQLQSSQTAVCHSQKLGTLLSVGVHGVCFLYILLCDSLWHAYKRCSVKHAGLRRNSGRASCLIWWVTSFCQQSVANSNSAVQKLHHTVDLLIPIPITFCISALLMALQHTIWVKGSSSNLWHSGALSSLENLTVDVLPCDILLLGWSRLRYRRIQPAESCKWVLLIGRSDNGWSS